MRYNLAYGSNTNIEQMRRRCPGAVLIGTGVIEGWRLAFQKSKTGFYLNIVPGGREDYVPVVVWGLDEEDERYMDICEGYPDCYRKQSFKLRVNNGKRGRNPVIKCFAYVMPKGRAYGLPKARYFERCSKGYKTFGFQQRLLDEAYMRSSLKASGILKGGSWKD